MKKKRFHEGMRGGGGGVGRVNRTSPSIFKRTQPIDMKLGMCKKCPVYF